MQANVGNIDKTFRAVLGVVLLLGAAFSFPAFLDGGVARIIAAIVGFVMLATSAFKFCPLYRILGIQTCKM